MLKVCQFSIAEGVTFWTDVYDGVTRFFPCTGGCQFCLADGVGLTSFGDEQRSDGFAATSVFSSFIG